MLAEQYRYAARMVGGTWPRPDMTVNVKLVLRYYYLRGMIHLGCNDFVMAHRCFWTCLTIPAEVCCKIAVEAWKKMILVQCIMNDGSDPKSNQISLPKSIPTCLARMLPSCKESTKTSPTATNPRVSHGPQPSGGLFPPARPLMSQAQSQSQSSNEIAVDTESTLCYMNIAVAFYGRKRSKLQALMEEHKSTIEGDGNCGLLQQCLTQLINNQVRHISRMYSVVSISKAATLLGISGVSDDATNQHVAALLCQSGIPCEIQEDGMIVFSDLSDQSTETSSLMELTEWMALIEKVQRLDVSILTTPRYQSLIRKDVSIGASGEGKVPNTMSSGPRGVDDL